MTDEEIRKLAAIMFTDMVGYNTLSQRDDQLAQELLEEHRQLLREIFPRFHGCSHSLRPCGLVDERQSLSLAPPRLHSNRVVPFMPSRRPPRRTP